MPPHADLDVLLLAGGGREAKVLELLVMLGGVTVDVPVLPV